MLAPGRAADLCVLAADPFAWDWHGGALPAVAATVVAGREVHGALA
jgi:predicted amidohydrolase YtcJ